MNKENTTALLYLLKIVAYPLKLQPRDKVKKDDPGTYRGLLLSA
jgi:hypothetical protein